MELNWDLAATLTRFNVMGTIILALNGSVVFVNERFADICGLPKSEMKDLDSVLEKIVYDATDVPIFDGMFQAAVKGDISSEMGFLIRGKDGNRIYVDIYFAPIVDSDENIVAVGALVFDVTARKILEKEHKEIELEYLSASRMASLGELASGIAHSINNPLAGLLGYLNLMSEDYPDEVRIKKCLDQCNRIGDLIQNLAYHGRNTLMTNPVRMDINELIDATLLLISSSKLYTNLQMETELFPGPVLVVVNPGDLTQVLLNILRNARDAVWGKPDGRIMITAAVSKDEVEISVKDNGRGIPREIRDRVFEPFFTTKPRGPMADLSPTGNGLGLSTSLQLVKSNGGRMELTSEAGSGTTVHIFLPKVTA